MSTKTNKSYAKRLRITRTGKILARRAGQAHFNAKASRSKQLQKNKTQIFRMLPRDISRVLPNS